MFLGGPGLTILIGLLWLPVMSILGALFALSGARVLLRWGRKTLIPLWATAALFCASIILTLLDPTWRGWQVNPHPGDDFLLFAVVSGALGVVLMPQMLVFRLLPPGHEARASGLLARGAALAAGTWILLVAIELTVEIVIARP
jgi:hypothetical protein